MSGDSYWESAAGTGLRFFGTVSASVTHEIRNRLAVINEKAGLIGDLADALSSGKSIDPDRLKAQSQRIQAQVQAANQFVGDFNRFSHSVDTDRARVDLGEVAGLVTALWARRAAMRNVTLQVEDGDRTAVIETNSFLLEHVVGACLDRALAAAAENDVITIRAVAGEDAVQLRLGGVRPDAEDVKTPPGQPRSIDVLLVELGGILRMNIPGSELILELPKRRHGEGGSNDG